MNNEKLTLLTPKSVLFCKDIHFVAHLLVYVGQLLCFFMVVVIGLEEDKPLEIGVAHKTPSTTDCDIYPLVENGTSWCSVQSTGWIRNP